MLWEQPNLKSPPFFKGGGGSGIVKRYLVVDVVNAQLSGTGYKPRPHCLKILRKHKIILPVHPALNVTDGINIPSGPETR